MRVLIYSAEFGNYENEMLQPVAPLVTQDAMYSYSRFSDGPNKTRIGVWHHREPLKQSKELVDVPQLRARFHKQDPLGLLHEEYDYTIWVDASMKLLVDPMELIDLLGDNDLMTFRHRHRNTIIEEGNTVIKIKQQDPQKICNQINFYHQSGYKDFISLPETGLMVRRCNKKIRKFNKFWWSQVKGWSIRDQMSFGFSVWKTGIKAGFFPGHVRSGRYNTLQQHRRNRCPKT